MMMMTLMVIMMTMMMIMNTVKDNEYGEEGTQEQ